MSRDLPLNRPALRLLGFISLIACLVFYDSTSSTTTHRLVVPLLMAAGSWALVQNATAVLLGISVLTFIHTDLAASHWIDRFAFPALAALSTLALLAILVARFRRYIKATHAERWTERRSP